MTRAVGLVVHPHRALGLDVATAAAQWLLERDYTVRVAAADGAELGDLGPYVADDVAFAEGLELAISIGGDGTMLRTVRLVSPAGTPILGVNVGHLGYLTLVEPDAWEPALHRVLAGDYDVEERMTLDVTRIGPDGAVTVARTALNDAVVEKVDAGRTVRVGLTISDQHAISYAADALIVATPTGSTAYNLSAGGPVVSPRLEAVIVTPVAAHSLFGRSLVVARHEVVRVELLDGAAVLGIDGRHCGPMAVGDAVECRAGEIPARLITFGERDFWRVITARFGLGLR